MPVTTPQLSGRVLLAEDTSDIQALITMLLKKAGLSVKAVDNGADALQYALRERYDLIIMDMQMPVMDGLSAIQQLRQSGFEQPIVSLTANATQDDKNRCLRAGADNFLVKPVDVALFYNLLSQYLPEQPQTMGSVSVIQDKSALLDPVSPAVDIAPIDEEMQQMINGFVNRLPETVQEITSQYRQRQWHELAVSSHRLKGAGGAFGFPELSEISEQIMMHVKHCDHDELCENELPKQDLQELIDRLNHSCQQITKKAG